MDRIDQYQNILRKLLSENPLRSQPVDNRNAVIATWGNLQLCDDPRPLEKHRNLRTITLRSQPGEPSSVWS